MGKTAVIFVVLSAAPLLGTEVVRAFVDRYRVRTQGVGGTQDITVIGIVIAASCEAAAVICGLTWLLTR